ncbi:amino acid ABC transporter permease [Actinobacillus pleuropneumoniae]|uniref:Amino acid ABC transporter permease n=2 Tax=Actinobacillus pleuropneumoniae TaxID=715 RepID=A0A9Q4DJE8_ACTPL|nr:amino acid ABC transporter permease [Actinobacillus pleuropneumoniae]ABY70275.1 putative ABC transporter, permease protein [Actinobacillus pleuropneumoniae serovar 3 str. JL03]MCL7721185.1 amino acid ABC transporter permease [Actinobacillus pleuropneumoniae]MCL7727123.1 amino acid ABC transporter permease [Actinobacillus pleuropneumoniae]MCL7730230.1 amino acid ABC transporter permease [Actinobacillus pleuropneumoniae]MCY6368623.1 amino acid ABC transporter permease [Actinobacillus pleuropn
MNWSYVVNAIPRFIDAAIITLQLSFWGILLSLVFGLLIAIVTAYQVKPFYGLARGYIELSRNTPLLIQLFFLYYSLPKIGIKWDGFTCGIIALVFLGASYMAEALRAGLLAVPKGQTEAAKAIGLNRFQVFRYVIFPQAWAVSIPAIGANVLFLIKETSVISAVAVAELMFVTKDIIGMDYKTNEALFLLFASYLVILLPISLLARHFENKARSAKYGV